MSSPDPVAAWARLVVARQVLERVAAGYREHGIDVLAVKGIITSALLYENPHERMLRDVDLRIRARDFGRALRASKALGFPILCRMNAYRSIILEVEGLEVDVESSIGPPGLVALSTDQVLARASLNAGGFWVPELHDHSVLLAVNVFKDKMSEAMPWALEDAARIVQVPSFDAGTFVRRLTEGRVAAIGWVVATWMSRHRGSLEWAEIRQRLGGDAPHRLYARVMASMFERSSAHGLPVRLLSRVGSDDRWRWPGALARAFAWELESRWGFSRS